MSRAGDRADDRAGEGAPGGADQGAGVVVDARGTRCPVPVLRLARAVRDLPRGSRATVLAEDPAVEHDVPAWASMRGHTVVATTCEEGVWAVTVVTAAPGRPA